MSVLTGPAEAALEEITINEENYAQVIEILRSRFVDSNTIKRSLYAHLKQISPPSSPVESLQVTLEKIESVGRQLSAFGEGRNQTSLLLSIQEKFPTWMLVELDRVTPPADPVDIAAFKHHLY